MGLARALSFVVSSSPKPCVLQHTLPWPRKVKTRGKPPNSVANKKHPLFKKVFAELPPVAVNDLPQSTAKKLMPPGAYIWRSNTVGVWRFNQPLFAHQGQCSWARYSGDSYKALLNCVQRTWDKYLQHHMLPRTHCPIKGLFAEGGE